MNTGAILPPPEHRLWRQWLWKLQIIMDYINKLLSLVISNFTLKNLSYGMIGAIGGLSLVMILYPPFRVISAANQGVILISYHLVMMFISGLLGLRMVYVSRNL